MSEDYLTVGSKRLLPLKGAAALFGYSMDYLGELCREQKISGLKSGGQWYVEEASVFAYLQETRERDLKRRQELSHHLSLQLGGRFSLGEVKAVSSRKFREKEPAPLRRGFLRGVVATTLSGLLFFGQVPIATAVSEGESNFPAFAQSASVWVNKLPSVLGETGDLLYKTVSTLTDDVLLLWSEPRESLLSWAQTVPGFMEESSWVLEDMWVSLRETGEDFIYRSGDALTDLVGETKSNLAILREGIPSVAEITAGLEISSVSAASYMSSVSQVFVEEVAYYADLTREKLSAAVSFQDGFSTIVFSLNDVFNSVVDGVTGALEEIAENTGLSSSTESFSAVGVTGTQVANSTSTQASTGGVAEPPVSRIIERIVRVEVPVIQQIVSADSSVNSASLDLRLEQIRNQLMSEISRFSGASAAQITNVYTTLGQASRIDRLTSTILTSPTISSATISGSTLSGSISASDATLSIGTLSIGSATTTASNGVNISTGCFAVAGTCLAGAGEGTVGQLPFYNLAGGTLAPTSTLFLTQGGLFGVGSTSPFAKLAVNPVAGDTNQFVVGSSTATAFLIDGAGKVGVGTTSPAQNLSVSGNAYITGGLGVGVATTTAGVLQTSSNAYFGGNLYVGGGSTVIGASSANSLSVNSSIASNFVPDANSTRNLGSASFYWGNAYVNILNANNIVAANTQIGGTQSADFTINSDNATADTEDMNLIFYRGTLGPNALLTWNSAASAERFEFNQNVLIQNASTSTVNPTLLVKGTLTQTSDIFQVASSSGNLVFNVSASSTVGVGSSTPWAKFAINPVAGDTNQFVVGSSTATAFIIDGAGRVGVGTTSPFAKLSVAGIGSFDDYVRASYFSATSTTATSTFSTGGFTVGTSQFIVQQNSGNVGIGTTSPFARLAVNPIAGDTNQFVVGSSTATSFIINPAGNVGIGLTGPATKLDVFEANAAAQLRLSKSASLYSELTVDSTGDLQVSAAGGDIRALTENLWICDGGSCPTLTATSTAGNIFVENAAVFGNGFSFRPISVNELGLYNASSSLLMVFDQVQ